MAPLIVVVVLFLFARSLAAARSIRVIPQARAGVVERLGRYSRTLEPGPTIVTQPARRLRRQAARRPARAGRQLLAAVGDLPRDNVVVGIETVGCTSRSPIRKSATWRNRESAAGDRAVDRHDPAQRDRRADPGGDADRAREASTPKARGDLDEGDRRVGSGSTASRSSRSTRRRTFVRRWRSRCRAEARPALQSSPPKAGSRRRS